MIVAKFGGTSLADAGRIRGAAEIVDKKRARGPVAVVVSAAGGVTNLLVDAVAAAEGRDAATMKTRLAAIRRRHEEILEGLGIDEGRRSEARSLFRTSFEKVEQLAGGMFLLGEATPRSRDRVLSAGEVLSHRLFTDALRARGVEAEAVDPRELVPTDDRFGAARVDEEELARRCRELLLPLLRRGAVPVTGGFVGATRDGITTTLGRGGSDWSAALIGAALADLARELPEDQRKAAAPEEIQIWTDVDGLMTADPRLVPEARLLRTVTFQEAAELSYFGARVLHPATVRPAVERGIPVRILNTFAPERPGTVIRRPEEIELDPRPHVRAVAWKKGITVVAVTSSRMLGAHGFLARLFQVFDHHATAVDLITTSEVSVSLTIDSTDALDALREELGGFCRTVEIDEGMAQICLVGHRLLQAPRLVGRILATLEGIPLRMVDLGSTDINLSLVLPEDRVEDAVRLLHREHLERRP